MLFVQELFICVNLVLINFAQHKNNTFCGVNLRKKDFVVVWEIYAIAINQRLLTGEEFHEFRRRIST